MERTRAQVRDRGRQSGDMKRMTRWFLRLVLPRPGLMRLGAGLLRLYQRTGLQKLLRATRLLRFLPGNIQQLEAQLPRMSRRFFGPSRRVYHPHPNPPPQGEGMEMALSPAGNQTVMPAKERHPVPRYGAGIQGGGMKVALLSGCVMPLMQAETMNATVRVLVRNGCEVAVPTGQGCCGALNTHAGDLETARGMARRNIDALLSAGADRIVTCSAGCGSTMKEYHELLKDDGEYAEKARRASEMTRDITEFLLELPFRRPLAHLERMVTYQDPCHLAHAQRITAAPRAILRAIPGVRLEEMENASMCCGGAGIYSAVQPTLSRRILSRKVEAIIESRAAETITANPGCMLQLEQGLRAAGQETPVRHVVDILDEAYRLEEPEPVRASRGRPLRRGPAPLQMDLEEARASQLMGRGSRGRRWLFGMLPGWSRMPLRSRSR